MEVDFFYFAFFNVFFSGSCRCFENSLGACLHIKKRTKAMMQRMMIITARPVNTVAALMSLIPFHLYSCDDIQYYCQFDKMIVRST